MLHFENNPTIHLRRPITLTSVAEALRIKPFELLPELIRMQVFVAPHQSLSDDAAVRRPFWGSKH